MDIQNSIEKKNTYQTLIILGQEINIQHIDVILKTHFMFLFSRKTLEKIIGSSLKRVSGAIACRLSHKTQKVKKRWLFHKCEERAGPWQKDTIIDCKEIIWMNTYLKKTLSMSKTIKEMPVIETKSKIPQ